MQGRNNNTINFTDSLKAFVGKLESWNRKVKIKNIPTFEKLSSVLTAGDDDDDDKIASRICKKMKFCSIQNWKKNEFNQYFPELTDEEMNLVQVHSNCQLKKFLTIIDFWCWRLIQWEISHRILAVGVWFQLKSNRKSYPYIASIYVDHLCESLISAANENVATN